MLHNLCELLKITGSAFRYLILLVLRSPFEALRIILQASFLEITFLAIGRKSIHELYWICAIFFIGSLLLFVYNGSIWMMYAKFTIKVTSRLREKMFEHVSSISLAEVEARSSGEWYTRLNADVKLATAIISQPLQLTHAVVAVINICVSSVIIYRMNTVIMLSILLFLLPHVIMNGVVITRSITCLTRKVQEMTSNNTSCMNSLITCADTALMYDAKDFLYEQYKESSLMIRKINMNIRLRTAFSDALVPIMGLGGYLVILLIGREALSADFTFSKLVALFQYRVGLISGAMMLTNCIIAMKASGAGAKRVLETMNIVSEES